MNYKIKFELDLSDIDKKDLQQTRDSKIEFLTSGESEFDISPQYKIPEKQDIILLNDKKYLVSGFKYQINKTEYKIIILVTPPNVKRINDSEILDEIFCDL